MKVKKRKAKKRNDSKILVPKVPTYDHTLEWTLPAMRFRRVYPRWNVVAP